MRAPGPVAQALGLRVAVVAAILPAVWGVGLPNFLLLDPVAMGAALPSGVVAGLGSALLIAGALVWRLRLRAWSRFPFRMARDVVLATTLGALLHFVLGRLDARVPYFEGFSTLCMEVATGAAAGLLLYVWCRGWLRQHGGGHLPSGLPGVRTLFGASAFILGLLTSVALGVGSAGRAAGMLDRERAERLVQVADLVATALHTAPPDRRAAVMDMLRGEQDLRFEVLPLGARPKVFAQARAIAETETGQIALLEDGRTHVVQRRVPGGVLWAMAPGNVRPPVRAPDDAPSMIILALLVLGAPLAALMVGHDVHQQLGEVTDALAAIGEAQAPSEVEITGGGGPEGPVGVPVASNDEVGDLAAELNAVCRRFAEETRKLTGDLAAAFNSDRARTAFLGAASHELRTPLESIRGYCHLLSRDEGLNPAQKEDIGVIAEAGDQLLAHVDEILDLARIESGMEQTLALQRVDLGELATQILSTQKKGVTGRITAGVDVLPGTPGVAADPQRLRQVLENLISNALKFTREGFVLVTIGPRQMPNGAPGVHLQVSDSGPGIPAEELEDIFTEFHRVQSQRDVVGTGLGLAIARRLVERHGGHLWAESVHGEGSDFHLLIPVQGSGEVEA